MYAKYVALRDEKGVTDYQVSKATGVSTAALSSWKTGRYSPKLDKIKKIADFFNVKVDFFLQ